MEPSAEFWDPEPARSVETPDGYVPYGAVTAQPQGLHRRMYALVILLALGATSSLFILMSLVPNAGDVSWTSLSPEGGFRYLSLPLVFLAASVLCGRGMLLGRIMAGLAALADIAWSLANLVRVLGDEVFLVDDFRSEWTLLTLANLVFPLFVLVLAAIAPSPTRPPRVRRPRFDPYSLNPYDDHPAFDGPQSSTQAADVADDATTDASDHMWRPADG
jgi:hypothetical protein